MDQQDASLWQSAEGGWKKSPVHYYINIERVLTFPFALWTVWSCCTIPLSGWKGAIWLPSRGAELCMIYPPCLLLSMWSFCAASDMLQASWQHTCEAVICLCSRVDTLLWQICRILLRHNRSASKYIQGLGYVSILGQGICASTAALLLWRELPVLRTSSFPTSIMGLGQLLLHHFGACLSAPSAGPSPMDSGCVLC